MPLPQSIQASRQTIVVQPPPSGAPSPLRLNFTIEDQQGTNWCWAAVGVSVASFYPTPISSWTQCSLASRVLAPASCCPGPSPCDQMARLGEVLTAIKHRGQVGKGTLDIAGIRAQIDSSRPIGARIKVDALPHFVVIYGYAVSNGAEFVDIADPAGKMTRQYSLPSFTGSTKLNWTHTYLTL